MIPDKNNGFFDYTITPEDILLATANLVETAKADLSTLAQGGEAPVQTAS